MEAIAVVLGLAYWRNSIRLLKRGLTNSGSVDRSEVEEEACCLLFLLSPLRMPELLVEALDCKACLRLRRLYEEVALFWLLEE